MRALVQRVAEARVEVVEDAGAREAARIGAGVLAFAGFAGGDDDEALAWMAAKIADLRIFPSPDAGLDRSLRDSGGELLVVSQFTLYGDCGKGRRPDFGAAAPYAEAEGLFERFLERCDAELPGRVSSGEFGATMRVALVNDGPVTLWLER